LFRFGYGRGARCPDADVRGRGSFRRKTVVSDFVSVRFGIEDLNYLSRLIQSSGFG